MGRYSLIHLTTSVAIFMYCKSAPVGLWDENLLIYGRLFCWNTTIDWRSICKRQCGQKVVFKGNIVWLPQFNHLYDMPSKSSLSGSTSEALRGTVVHESFCQECLTLPYYCCPSLLSPWQLMGRSGWSFPAWSISHVAGKSQAPAGPGASPPFETRSYLNHGKPTKKASLITLSPYNRLWFILVSSRPPNKPFTTEVVSSFAPSDSSAPVRGRFQMNYTSSSSRRAWQREKRVPAKLPEQIPKQLVHQNTNNTK